MSTVGTGDTSAMEDIIHFGEALPISFRLVKIPGMQDKARRIEPLQVTSFADDAMDLTSAFEQCVDQVATDKTGASSD